MDKLLDRYEYSEERSRKVLEEHTSLVGLLKAGKLTMAQQAIESHIHETVESIRKITAVARERQGH